MNALNTFEIYLHEPLVQSQFMKDPSDETLEAITKYNNDISEYTNKVWLDKDLYKIVKDYNSSIYNDGSHDKLTSEEQRFIKSVVFGFEKAGVLLSDETKKKIKQSKDKGRELNRIWKENEAEDDEVFEISEQDLKTVPREDVVRLEKSKKKEGYRVLKLLDRSASIISWIDNEETRKEYDAVFNVPAHGKNTHVFE